MSDQPNIFYHVAPASARESIRTNGLRASLPANNPIWEGEADIEMQPFGVYFVSDLDDAQDWIIRADRGAEVAFDIWKIYHPEPEYVEGDYLPGGIDSFYDPEDISSEHIQIIETARLEA